MYAGVSPNGIHHVQRWPPSCAGEHECDVMKITIQLYGLLHDDIPNLAWADSLTHR
jgi:hypothetical protein